MNERSIRITKHLRNRRGGGSPAGKRARSALRRERSLIYNNDGWLLEKALLSL
jgi:hypothetical protein